MTNEEKQQSLARARALLEELDATPPYVPAAENVHSSMPYEPAEDALTRWKREAEEAEAAREAAQMQTTAELNQQRSAQWEAWATAIITRELAKHDRVTVEGTGMALGQVRRELREEIRNAVAELRTELTLAKARDDGAVLDLPSPLLLRRHDAA